MSLRRHLLSAVAAISVGASAGAASAGVIFSEDFNSGFNSGYILGNAYQSSERWVDTTYYYIENADGWTFHNGAYLAMNLDNPGDSALLLNENGYSGLDMATHLLSCLVIGQQYTVSMLVSGDNAPGYTWELLAGVGGSQLLDVTGVDGIGGCCAGTTQSFTFNATATSETLSLGQLDDGPASPIVDNIVVSTADAPGGPEPASWALMILGFGGVGSLLRHSRARRLAVAV